MNEGTKRKRIAMVGEFDNGHVFRDYKEMTDNEAEDQARRASLGNPDKTFYVVYDDVMNSSSNIRWVSGKGYKYIMK